MPLEPAPPGIVADSKSRAERRRFVSKASHELRQPLAALNLLFYDKRQLDDRDSREAILEAASASLDMLQRYVNQVIDYEGHIAGVPQPEFRDLALAPLLERLETTHRPLAAERGLRLYFAGHRYRLHSDPDLLEEILSQLLANALAFTSEGGVLLGCRRRGHRLVIQVWDSGCGVDPRMAAEMFEPYVQGDNNRGGDGSGLGLGLTIARQLCGLLETRLEWCSIPGKGSVFCLGLPMSR